MARILQESVGCMLQDQDRHIYRYSKKRFKELFFGLLEESEYVSEEDIEKIKENVKAFEVDEWDEPVEDEHYYYDGREAWVEFKDLYSTKTSLYVVD